MKVCTQCGVGKPLEAFYKRAGTADGHQAACRACCVLAREKLRDPRIDRRRDEKEAETGRWIAAQSRPCAACGIDRPFSEFHKQTRGRLGLQSQCKDCNRKASLKCVNASRAADPQKFREREKESYVANPGDKRASSAKRRAAKLQRTPPWADLEAIEAFYIACPKGCHVDHIIPLQGENISGLHVLENLQYLTAEANLSKGNKYPY